MRKTESDEFLRLLLENQTRIYAFILGLVGNYSDADDIMQETTSLLWKKFDEFTPGTDFVAWGISVARYKVQNYRQKRQRMRKRVIFDDDILERISPKTEQANQYLEDRIGVVRGCLKKLKERDSLFLQLRYYDKIMPKEISGRLGMTIQAVYKRLARVHARLLKCVKLNLSKVDM